MAQQNNNKTRKKPAAAPVKQSVKTAQTQVKPQKPQTIYTLLAKAAIFFLVVVAVVKFTDLKGYFNPDYTGTWTPGPCCRAIPPSTAMPPPGCRSTC